MGSLYWERNWPRVQGVAYLMASLGQYGCIPELAYESELFQKICGFSVRLFWKCTYVSGYLPSKLVVMDQAICQVN